MKTMVDMISAGSRYQNYPVLLATLKVLILFLGGAERGGIIAGSREASSDSVRCFLLKELLAAIVEIAIKSQRVIWCCVERKK